MRSFLAMAALAWVAQASDSPDPSNTTVAMCEYNVRAMDERCDYIKQHPLLCGGDPKVDWYLKMYSCARHEQRVYYLATAFIGLGLLFHILGTTADVYFCPQVEELSDRMGLTPRVAGVTMLSLGNGAPDVFAGISAIQAGQMQLVMGQLVGGALFVTSIVGGLVIMTAGGIRTRFPLLRDVMMFVAVLGGLLALLRFGWLGWEIAVVLLVYYAIFVGLAIYSDRQVIKRAVANASHNAGVSVLLSESLGGMSKLERSTTQSELVNNEYRLACKPRVSLGTVLDHFSYTSEGVHRRTHSAYLATMSKAFIDWVEGPFTVARNFTILNCTKETWEVDNDSRLKAGISVLGTPFLIAYWKGFLGGYVGGCPTWVVILCIGLVLMWCFMRTCPYAEPPRYVTCCLVVGFVASAVWVDLLADQLISILTSVGYALGLSPIFMGATILAWGNSVGDMGSNVVLARNKREGMAITACVAGPLFNILVVNGFGLLAMGKLHVRVHLTTSLYICFGFLIGTLSVILVTAFAMGKLNPDAGNRVPKDFWKPLFGLYAVFLVLMFYDEIAVF